MFIHRIVSRIREQLQAPQKRRNKQQQQYDPPDLRRWSDFQNPFPSVSPGGYKRYYDKHRGIPVAGISRPSLRARAPLSPLTQPPKPVRSPKQDFPMPECRDPAQPSSSASFSSVPTSPTEPVIPSVPVWASKPSSGCGVKVGLPHRLSTIHEGSIPKSESQFRRPSAKNMRHGSVPTESEKETRVRLRRRQWRLLRTPSIIKDFASEPDSPPRRFKFRSLDVEGYVFLSKERSPSDRRREVNVKLVEEKINVGLKRRKGIFKIQEPEQRPNSWNTFHSAKSHFSDV